MDHRCPALLLNEKLMLFSTFTFYELQVAREGEGFKLCQRAQHVFEEEKRVLEFKAVCDVSSAFVPVDDIELTTSFV